MTKRNPAPLLAELRHLADDPVAQARFAAGLLVGERRPQVFAPALMILEQQPLPEARLALLALYSHLDSNGVRLDAGGGFRASILRILRPWITAADQGLLERAVTTYEYQPPARSEEAGPIRAAGLVALSDIDPELAGFHATRLLADHAHTSAMSGEPGKTAAGVLAVRAESLPLYLYTLQDPQHAEVTAECLRHLAGAPDAIVRELCERFGAHASEVAQIGLIDMLLVRPARPLFQSELRARLRARSSLAVVHYLAVAIVASRQPALVEDLTALAEAEDNPARRAVLAEALELLPITPTPAGSRRRGRLG